MSEAERLATDTARRLKTARVSAHCAATARAMASCGADALGCSGLQGGHRSGGHGSTTLSLSVEQVLERRSGLPLDGLAVLGLGHEAGGADVLEGLLIQPCEAR